MDVLVRQIYNEFQKKFDHTPARDEVEDFVRQAFHARNVSPTDALVERLVAHLAEGRPFGHLRALNVKHCGQ